MTIFIILIIAIIVVAAIIIAISRKKSYSGGYHDTKKAKSIVIDTLNMTHELFDKQQSKSKKSKSKKYVINQADINKTIIKLTEKLKPTYSDKIIFVVKTQESLSDEKLQLIRDNYKNLSKDLKVEIHLVEKLKDSKVKFFKGHSALGRDDFYIKVISWENRFPILSNDRFRDLEQMKFGELDSFYVRIYTSYKLFEAKTFINPTAHRYKKIRTFRNLSLEYV
jgi:hypothetical protein